MLLACGDKDTDSDWAAADHEHESAPDHDHDDVPDHEVPDHDHDTVPDHEHDGDASLPVGVVLMWSGELDEIPDGWALCDGEDDTPDLTGRFVVGADEDALVGSSGEGGATVSVETTSVLRCNGCTSEENPLEAVEITDVAPPWYALAYIVRVE